MPLRISPMALTWDQMRSHPFFFWTRPDPAQSTTSALVQSDLSLSAMLRFPSTALRVKQAIVERAL